MDKIKQGECGRFNGWIRPPAHEFFKPACIIHDYLYQNVGGDFLDRFIADNKFYEVMVKEIKKVPYRYKRTYYYISAFTYHKIVRSFGWVSFKYK